MSSTARPTGAERDRVAGGLARRSAGCSAGGSDGFESRMDSEAPKDVADVVPDRLGAQVQLGGDLLGRAALLQKTKHLDLTGGEMRVWRCRPIVGAFLDQPEDADYSFTASQR